MTGLSTAGLNMAYRYPSDAVNDGRLWQQEVNGQTVAYEYDALGRLTKAETTGAGWGLTFGYDGFGNLLTQSPTAKGATVSMSLSVNPANNRVLNPGVQYDANGVYTFRAPDGREPGRYNLAGAPVEEKVWFAGQLIGRAVKVAGNNGWLLERIVTDRLGSVRIDAAQTYNYYPYGNEIGATANGRTKFGTYFRDSGTLDYADQRYYSPGTGRFLSADPYNGSAATTNPLSFNRYGYTYGDPVNNNDPNGLLTLILGGHAPAFTPLAAAFSFLVGQGSFADWAAFGTPFNQSVSAHFGEPAAVFTWSGGASSASIRAGGEGLAAFIRSYNFQDGEKLNIVAHSHGGNVVKHYTTLPGPRRIDTLITLGTPQRGDFHVQPGSVGTYLNVYSKFDIVQPFGGRWLTARFAGRTDRCAINIGIDWAPGVGNVGHGDLHTPAVWDLMRNWLVRAGYGTNPVDATTSYCCGGGLGFPPGPPDGMDQLAPSPDEVMQ